MKVQLEKRRGDPELSHMEELEVDWVDAPHQKLDVEFVLQIVKKIEGTLEGGEMTILPRGDSCVQ